MLTRRSFLPLLAAPAILKLGIHMPISSAKLDLVAPSLAVDPALAGTGRMVQLWYMPPGLPKLHCLVFGEHGKAMLPAGSHITQVLIDGFAEAIQSEIWENVPPGDRSKYVQIG